MMEVIGQSPKLLEVLRTADLVAGTDVPVLIMGNTGTGKDLFAQRIHQRSTRKQQSFIKVSCTSEFIETEIFAPKKGAIAQAHRGTLFLDEIAALPDSVQLNLLHFLESGDTHVRVIVATHKNLYDEVKAGKFRAELFYRLNVIPVELPTLKEREGDVEILIDYFFRYFVAEQHQAMPSFTKSALKRIAQYDWPGNIRELHNFSERMFILFSGRQVDVGNLPHEFGQFTHKQSSSISLPETGIKLETIEVDLILQALQNTHGNKSKAARLLGLTRDTFLYRLKKYSIES